MAHNFALRARKVAWSFHDDKSAHNITHIRRVGTDSTLNDDDDGARVSTSVTRLQHSTDIRAFVSVLKRDGCVIVENFTDLASLQKATTEARSWLKAQEAGNPVPLIQHCPTIRDTFYANEMYQGLCEEFLTVETTRRKNNRLTSQLCQPTLSSAVSRELQSTGAEKEFSRYDTALGIRHERVHRYHHGRDSMLGLLVPSSERIRFHTALGSHLNGTEDPNPVVVEEELKSGEALIVLGSLYHYVAAQTKSQADAEPALVHNMWSCAGVYRPEESAAVMINAAELKTYPEVVQERLK